jgi:adenosine phosphosulfate reductase beta subunit
MPSFVNVEKCDGCKALDKTACQHICPNDLMVLDKESEKAYNREPEMCWECYNCVKICPTQAVDVRGYADFVPMGASVVPLRSTDSIMWTVKFRSGAVQVPDPHHSGGRGGAQRRLEHRPGPRRSSSLHRAGLPRLRRVDEVGGDHGEF